jgi:hypothetical protein
MKTNVITLLALVAGLSGVSIIAQDAPPPGEPRPPGRERGPGGAGGGEGGMRMRMPLMTALDTNNDGTIDATEIAQASKSLKTLDKNNDGKLTAEELRPARPDRPGQPGQSGQRPERPAPPQ